MACKLLAFILLVLLLYPNDLCHLQVAEAATLVMNAKREGARGYGTPLVPI